ncbi:hypothetical protein AQS8620_01516 [Aquimixticola soesokkakensis]|uniref:Porin domain-containing protein n=1 Tax=Aquimixticola soesokkakensis TaxID=1519096 RepID=A0A1Y5SL62_9RHOB|nr:hypothetical protein [Aquimixticola soesokkakensis]SLN40228.1 hypothetical protein AQS8620_01516 [Aquimixticola soesokkakensis]
MTLTLRPTLGLALGALTLTGLPLAAIAGPDYLSYSSSFTAFGDGDGAIYLPELDVAADYSFGNVVLSGALSAAKAYTDDSSDGELNIYGGDITAGYRVLPDFTLSAGYGATKIEGALFETYTLGSEYHSGSFSAGVSYASDGDDTSNTAIFAGYDAGGLYATAGAFLYEDSTDVILALGNDTGSYASDAALLFNSDEDTTLAALDVKYNIGRNFRALGEVFYADLGESDLTVASIGGGYQFQNGTWMDLTGGKVWAEGDDVAHVITLELSVETGRRALQGQKFRDDYSEALPAFLDVFVD